MPRRPVESRLRHCVLVFFLAVLPALPWAASRAAAAAVAPVPSDRALYRIAAPKARDLGTLLRLGLDIAGTGPGGSLDLVLTTDDVARLRALGFAPALLGPAGRGPLAAAESPTAKPGLGLYHTVDESNAEMATYAAAYPAIARLDTLGLTIEGRPIVAIEISDHVGLDEGEPEALVMGCHHARELMSVEVPLYLMRRLLDGYGVDPVLTSLVDGRDIWIVPIVNPDGHVYVEENANGQSDTWWRKNRRPNADGTFGVDLNRNYGYAWGYDDAGSSPTPSSEVYRGTGPFSEPETGAIRTFVDAHRFTVSLSFHSYGDLVLYPWGYFAGNTPDQAIFAALGDSMAVLNGYLAGNAASHAIYITNGDSDDWMYGEGAEKPRAYGFTIEVNTAAEGGFAPSESLIDPTCASNFGPMLALLRYADRPRRVLPPPRPVSPHVTADVGGYALRWHLAADDPDNEPVRYDLRRIGSVLRVLDDAEAGTADWDTTRFEWTTARHASGTHADWSGSGDSRVSLLTSKASLDVGSNDSLVVMAFWDLETNFDYWYAEASTDDGGTWTGLAGNFTTNLDPNGLNDGFGITGSSGSWQRAAFSLLPFTGKQARVRFRCVTDASVHGEGLYLDDLAPTPRYAGVTVEDTGSPDSTAPLSPPPATPTWLDVRAVDAEGQSGRASVRVLFDPSVTGVAADAVGRAGGLRIAATPNPFNPSTTIRFSIPPGIPGAYRLDAYDVGGRWIARIAAGRDDGRGGSRAVVWDARDHAGRPLASGVYLLRLVTPGGARSAKLTLLR
ncbi:MAG: M14 family zinc carboxypeptidase [Hyphomicrobiales bacterium]